MTANRWWVRAAARWLARFDTTKSQLQAMSLAVTAFSTFSLVLQNAGLGEYVPYVGVGGAGLWIVYTFYYSEGGVHNQKQRDMVDLSDNYSGPTMLMDSLVHGRQYAELVTLLAEQMRDEPLSDEEREEIHERILSEGIDEWQDLRNGIDDDLLEDA